VPLFSITFSIIKFPLHVKKQQQKTTKNDWKNGRAVMHDSIHKSEHPRGQNSPMHRMLVGPLRGVRGLNPTTSGRHDQQQKHRQWGTNSRNAETILSKVNFF
jgi:hypothetical protein